MHLPGYIMTPHFLFIQMDSSRTYLFNYFIIIIYYYYFNHYFRLRKHDGSGLSYFLHHYYSSCSHLGKPKNSKSTELIFSEWSLITTIIQMRKSARCCHTCARCCAKVTMCLQLWKLWWNSFGQLDLIVCVCGGLAKVYRVIVVMPKKSRYKEIYCNNSLKNTFDLL